VNEIGPDNVMSLAKFLLHQKEFQHIEKAEIIKYIKRATLEGEHHQTKAICWVDRS
jgi:hypothetical protein